MFLKFEMLVDKNTYMFRTREDLKIDNLSKSEFIHWVLIKTENNYFSLVFIRKRTFWASHI